MHAEAQPTDWLQLADEMRRLAENPDISEERREWYLRSSMHYEVEALAAHLRDPVPMRTEDLP